MYSYLRRLGVPSVYRHWTMNILILMLFYSLFLWTMSIEAENSVFHRLEGLVYDARLSLTLSERSKDVITEVIVVDIDEKSLSRIGRWPWSREVIVDLLQRLQESGVILTAMDVVFAEPEINVVDRMLSKELSSRTQNELKALAPSMDFDQQLAEQLTRQDVVLGFLFLPNSEERSGVLEPSSMPIANYPAGLPVNSFVGFTAPLKPFVDNALGTGFVTIRPDSDGVIRRVPLVVRYGSYLYPSLALEASRQYLLTNMTEVEVAETGDSTSIVALTLDEVRIPTNRHGEVIVPYRGKTGTFRYISAADILNGQVFPELRNSIVLIGTSAVGLGELSTTPLEPLFPGVEIHANIIDSIVNSHAFPYQPDWYPGAVIVVMFLSALFLTILLPTLNALLMPLVGLAFLSGLTLLNFATWKYLHLDFPLVIPALLIVAISFKEVARGYVHEQSQRLLIKQHFDKYVPPAHIERMLSRPENVNLEGEKKDMTVLFADIRSFTSISEGLSTQELKLLLNMYFTPVTQIIFNHQGTVDKFVGDMVMAFWNAPLDDADHAHHAILTAKEMLKTTRKLRRKFLSKKLPPIYIGIGVNTGEMNVGDMGSDTRRNYTVLGDSVNLGARLEGLTKFYGLDLLVGPDTKLAAPLWLYRHIDRVAVKGKTEPRDIYEPVGLLSETHQTEKDFCERHNLAMEAYLAGRFEDCEEAFKTLHQERPEDAVYAVILQRLLELKKSPPEDWQGVYTHTSK